ncbi:MAG: ABC transporter ATP-binding protein [Alphaproteobacteria bacterium 64-11]|nr:MAG: ABC transporter ATP-binding protein [Alphaproteobacteria bacterium 64-11]
MSAQIEARELTKRFGAVTALDRLSFSVPEGGVYGILGANGAGKSTFFRLCLDLVRPSGGGLSVLGGAPGQVAVRRQIGAMIETPRYYPTLTAAETLMMLARTSGVRAPEIGRWLARVGLMDAVHRKVRHFSVGMKQRLGIAAALIANPRLLILDEPTSGMDPAGILEMRTLIRELAAKDGVTILLSSHLLDEVQRTCDRVAIFARGTLVAEGRIDVLLAGQEKLRLLATSQQALLAALGGRGVCDGDGVLMTVSRAETPSLLRALVDGGIDLIEARWMGGGLEKFYLEQTGGDHAG